MNQLVCVLFFLDFIIYLRDRDRERERAHKWGMGEVASSLSNQLSVGLDPRTLGPQSKLKADAQATETPRHPNCGCVLMNLHL